MTAERSFISFVIPVRNDANRLGGCLASIAANVGSDQVHVIVADNGSTDGSGDVAAAAGATVVRLPQGSLGELRNTAAAQADSPLVAFVDADHIIDPGWVTAALEVLRDPAIGGAGAPCVGPADANWIQRAYGRLRPKLTSAQPVEWLGSGNMVVRRSAFDQVGGFDTLLETCEDVDLCNRLRAAGYHLVADPRMRNVHLGDPATVRGLFYGELWRGRNNLKVTLRGPLTLRALPSLVIPIVELICLGVLAASPWLGLRVAAGAGLVFLTPVVLRAAFMTLNWPPATVRDVLANLAVATCYDVARAASLLARATHRQRRQVPEERAVA